MSAEIQRLHLALALHEMPPVPHEAAQIEAATTPAGGDWECVANPGATTRSIIWRGKEVALINPRGDFTDPVECHLAMGIRATPLMSEAIRAISTLADDVENLALIQKIAATVLHALGRPAPPITEPEERDVGDD